MKSFINNNQSLITVLAIVGFLVVLYFIFKALPTKVVKKEKKEIKKEQEVPVETIQETNDESEKEQKTEDIEKTQSSNKKEEKKPKIVQVYKRKEREQNSDNNKSFIDPIYDRNVEFVNTSKNIAKFKSFVDENQVVEESVESENVDEFGFVEDVKEDCNYCQENVKHFDHTKRLSKMINSDNLDGLFGSHITEKYLNIKADRHLRLDENFSDALFSRTEAMLKNSDDKVKNDEYEKEKFSLFYDNSEPVLDDESDENDDIEINMKMALLAETYFGKRKKK